MTATTVKGETFCRKTAVDTPLTREEMRHAVSTLFAPWRPRVKRLLIVPPDITRANSGAGMLTRLIVAHARERQPGVHIDILPALGTHAPMTDHERVEMFGDLPAPLFKVHNWRTGLVKLGEVPGSFVNEVSGGRLEYAVTVEISEMVAKGNYDLIASVGQVVPHEVAGMANGNKNIIVGTGGQDTINKTHFLGAVCNMETIMGRAENPVRSVFDFIEHRYLSSLHIAYIQSVMSDVTTARSGMAGLFVGTGGLPFREAAALSRKLNITLLDTPLKKVIVYLDPREFKSTWLGNKAIYRTRMAMADGGELIVLAPGVEMFGEDVEIDRLIRKYGYRGTPVTLAAVTDHKELRANLSAAAHLIHGSTEGRFSVTFAPGKLTREEIAGVGFRFGDLKTLMANYNPEQMQPGMNTVEDEDVYFIRNPALGLWATKQQFAADGGK